MTMTPKEVLIAAKAKIADPPHWTRKTFARDSEGKAIDSKLSTAVCWCALGALETVLKGLMYCSREYDLLVQASAYWGDTPSAVNDHMGHDAVMRMYDKAIKLADKELMT